MGSSDIFSSSYGPGVIGTAAAIFVLLGFGGLYVFVFDKSLQGGGERIEVSIEQNARDIDNTRKSITAATARLKKTEDFARTLETLQRTEVKSASLATRIEGLEGERESGASALAAAEEAFADYRRQYRESARAALVGKTYDELRTSDGKVFTNVKVTEVDPLRMSIRHDGGITGVDLTSLPEDLQEFLQIDHSERDERKELETTVAKTTKHGAEIAALQEKIGNLKYEIGEQQRKVDTAKAALDRSVTGIPALEARIAAKKLELEAENRKAGSGGISRAPAVTQQLRALENNLAQARARLPELQRQVATGETRIRELQDQVDQIREKIVELGKSPDAASEESK